jgi:two-component system response regulator
METYDYVLYIEDDEDDVLVFTESFKTISDLPVVNLSDALQLQWFIQNKMNGQYPCLLITDINMPRCTGIELLRQIRSNDAYAQTPVAILSTSYSHADKDVSESMGAQVFTKPNTFKQWQEVGKVLLTFCHSLVKPAL